MVKRGQLEFTVSFPSQCCAMSFQIGENQRKIYRLNFENFIYVSHIKLVSQLLCWFIVKGLISFQSASGFEQICSGLQQTVLFCSSAEQPALCSSKLKGEISWKDKKTTAKKGKGAFFLHLERFHLEIWLN